jgi:SAM-dependent methyltransferase
MLFFKKKSYKTDPEPESLGLGLPPGGNHYRAFVGPPEDYDLVSAMAFGLLTSLGLRQHHSVLDVGCGSLRIGRLLIPYLNAGSYTGIEPNAWLVEQGIKREIGSDLVGIKNPRFHFFDSAASLPQELKFDFALAQSIFSHCGPDLLKRWINEISGRLSEYGVIVATFLIADDDCVQNGWIYPGCVHYRPETMRLIANAAGLEFTILDWVHPRQTWALFHKPGFDATWIYHGHVEWNAMMKHKIKV